MLAFKVECLFNSPNWCIGRAGAIFYLIVLVNMFRNYHKSLKVTEKRTASCHWWINSCFVGAMTLDCSQLATWSFYACTWKYWLPHFTCIPCPIAAIQSKTCVIWTIMTYPINYVKRVYKTKKTKNDPLVWDASLNLLYLCHAISFAHKSTCILLFLLQSF